MDDVQPLKYNYVESTYKLERSRSFDATIRLQTRRYLQVFAETGPVPLIKRSKALDARCR